MSSVSRSWTHKLKEAFHRKGTSTTAADAHSFASEPAPSLLPFDSVSHSSARSLSSLPDDSATVLNRPFTVEAPASPGASSEAGSEVSFPSLSRRGASRKAAGFHSGHARHGRSISDEGESPDETAAFEEDQEDAYPPSGEEDTPTGTLGRSLGRLSKKLLGKTSTVSGAKPESMNVAISENMRTKPYGMLLPPELAVLQNEAAARLDWILQSTDLDPSGAGDRLLRKHVRTSSERDADGRRWWSTLSLRKKQTNLVTGAPIQKSIGYASVTLSNTVSPECRVPIIVYECCRFIRDVGLHTEGIFRVSGSERRVAAKYPEFDAAPDYGLNTSWDGYNVHDVAAILKKYLREIPEPLLTNDLYPYFLQLFDVSNDENIRLKYIQCLVCLLPPSHLVAMEFIFELLVEIARNAERTQMTASNLARVLAPTILRHGSREAGSSGSLSASQEVAGAGLPELETAAEVIEYMLQTYPRWGRITSPRARPFMMLYGDLPSDEVEALWIPHEIGIPEGRTSTDSFRRGDDSFGNYDSRHSFLFPNAVVDAAAPTASQMASIIESNNLGRASTSTSVSWRPSVSPIPINFTLTLQEAGQVVAVPLGIGKGVPPPSPLSEIEAPIWPEGPRIRRSRTAPAKRGRARGWFIYLSLFSPYIDIRLLADGRDSPLTIVLPTPADSRHSLASTETQGHPEGYENMILRRSMSTATDSMGRRTRRGGEDGDGDGSTVVATNSERIRALETEVRALSEQMRYIISGHREVERQLGGGVAQNPESNV